MVKVLFNGNTGNGFYFHIGGIIEQFYLCSSYDSIVKDCANYGDIMYSGCAHIQKLDGLLENTLDIPKERT